MITKMLENEINAGFTLQFLVVLNGAFYRGDLKTYSKFINLIGFCR